MGSFGIDRIKSFEIVTLRTSGMRYVCEYEIVMKDCKAEVSLYDLRFSQDHDDSRVLRKRAECDTKKVLTLLNDCDLLSWNGFHGKHPKGVLDGTMFTLNASVNDGTRIYADGSQNFPKKFRLFTDALYEILNAGNSDKSTPTA